jgi:hypothetical protein
MAWVAVNVASMSSPASIPRHEREYSALPRRLDIKEE